MDAIITDIMQICGIYEPPVTVSDFLWDVLIIFVGLCIIKVIMLIVVELIKLMIRL